MNRRCIFAILGLFLFFGGCGFSIIPQVKSKKEKVKPAIVTVQEALFCFKCHSTAQYNGAGGKFPHQKHMKEFGLAFHCNQCHDVKGHKKMKVIQKTNEPCSKCH